MGGTTTDNEATFTPSVLSYPFAWQPRVASSNGSSKNGCVLVRGTCPPRRLLRHLRWVTPIAWQSRVVSSNGRACAGLRHLPAEAVLDRDDGGLSRLEVLPAKAVIYTCPRGYFFFISFGSPHARPMGAHRTCGGPSETELTAIGVELNGWGRVRGGRKGESWYGWRVPRGAVPWRPCACSRKRAVTHFGWVFSLIPPANHTYAPCGVRTQMCARNRIDPHGVELNGWRRGPQVGRLRVRHGQALHDGRQPGIVFVEDAPEEGERPFLQP